MNLETRIKSLLQKAGLTEKEAEFYLFVLENQGCSISDVCKKCKTLSKSSAYRAFESLNNLDLLDSDNDSWKTNLQPISLEGLINKLENQNRRQKHLISELKTLNTARTLTGSDQTTQSNSKVPYIETFRGEEMFEKYTELSERKYDTNLTYGSWEDFAVDSPFLKCEKKFIKNRLKKGANAFCLVTKVGPYTHEIIDYDKDEDRISKKVIQSHSKPTWIVAFEGNDLTYVLDMDDHNQPQGTLINSNPIANFYRNFIYGQGV